MSKFNLENNDTIDHDKWSRQIRTYGIEITKRLSKLKILMNFFLINLYIFLKIN